MFRRAGGASVRPAPRGRRSAALPNVKAGTASRCSPAGSGQSSACFALPSPEPLRRCAPGHAGQAGDGMAQRARERAPAHPRGSGGTGRMQLPADSIMPQRSGSSTWKCCARCLQQSSAKTSAQSSTNVGALLLRRRGRGQPAVVALPCQSVHSCHEASGGWQPHRPRAQLRARLHAFVAASAPPHPALHPIGGAPHLGPASAGLQGAEDGLLVCTLRPEGMASGQRCWHLIANLATPE